MRGMSAYSVDLRGWHRKWWGKKGKNYLNGSSGGKPGNFLPSARLLEANISAARLHTRRAQKRNSKGYDGSNEMDKFNGDGKEYAATRPLNQRPTEKCIGPAPENSLACLETAMCGGGTGRRGMGVRPL